MGAEEAAESPYAMELRRLESLLREAEASFSVRGEDTGGGGGALSR